MLARYLLKRSLAPLAVALLGLTCLLSLLQVMRLGHLLSGVRLEPSDLVLLLAGTPAIAAYVTPLAIAAAFVTCGARLHADGELEAMAAAGASEWQTLRWLLLLLGLAVVASHGLFSLGAPVAGRLDHSVRRLVIRSALTRLAPGRFQEIGGITIFCGTIERSAANETIVATDVLLARNGRAEARRRALPTQLILAKRALISVDPDATSVQITLERGQMLWPEPLRPIVGSFDVLQSSWRLPDTTTTHGFIEQLIRRHRRSRPWACLAFGSLALTLAFGRRRARRAMTATLSIAALELALHVGALVGVELWLGAFVTTGCAIALVRRGRRI